MAIRLVQFVSGRTVGWTHTQSVGARSIWLPSYHDVLLDMDGNHDLYSCLCTVSANPCIWGGHVWNFVGCLPGKLCVRNRAIS